MAQRTASLPTTPQARSSGRTLNLSPRMRGIIIRQIFLQIFLLTVLATVLFPVLWIISMAIDPRGITRPTDLNLLPPNANIDAFSRLLTEPFSNVLPLYFGDLLMNSLFIALGTSLFTVILGSSAAYSFSRFRFIGRQGGMLAFIILLMLPATGIVIPLYVLFSSVQVNRTLAQLPPSVFNGALVAGIIWLFYSLVRSFGKPNLERTFNPSPALVAGSTAVVVLIAIVAFFYVLFDRSPVYAEVVKTPVAVLRTEFSESQEDYNRRVTSVSQRERTALRQEEDLEEQRALLLTLDTVARESAALDSVDAIRPLLQAQIDARVAAGAAEDDLIVEAMTIAIGVLDSGGVAGYQAGIASAVENARIEVADAEADALSARTNATEAAAELIVAEDRLIAARDAFNDDAAAIFSARDQAILQMVPYILLAWGGALLGAAVIWGALGMIKGLVAPRAAINLLAWGLILTVFAVLTVIALQGRLANVDPSSTQTLRTTLTGLALAFASGGLPFAVWNLKGYFDTIPKELEEAALIDGAGLIRTFIQVIMPLALPAFAIVILFSFMQGWTEFILSWVFLTGATGDYTLAMALATMANGANSPPPDMQKFAAMAILISAPIMILFFGFQRWIVGGLSLGGVKG